MRLFLLRHGQTPGNLARRYIGRTDENLSGAGRAQANSLSGLPDLSLAFVSPLRRAVQTARICLPRARLEIIDDLRELDFGDFEGRSADDMVQDPAYRQWVEAGCQGQCPGGEEPAFFRQRVLRAFADIIEQAARQEQKSLAVVSHGGVIMTIMATHARPVRPFFAWHVANCGGYRLELNKDVWASTKTFTDFVKL